MLQCNVGVHLMTHIILTQHGLVSYEYSTEYLVISKCVHPAFYEVIPLCMIIINGTHMQFVIHKHGGGNTNTEMIYIILCLFIYKRGKEYKKNVMSHIFMFLAYEFHFYI